MIRLRLQRSLVFSFFFCTWPWFSREKLVSSLHLATHHVLFNKVKNLALTAVKTNSSSLNLRTMHYLARRQFHLNWKMHLFLNYHTKLWQQSHAYLTICKSYTTMLLFWLLVTEWRLVFSLSRWIRKNKRVVLHILAGFVAHIPSNNWGVGQKGRINVHFLGSSQIWGCR